MTIPITSAEQPDRARSWRRAAMLAILCAGLVALIASDGFHGLLMDVLGAAERIISRHALLGAALFVLLAAASAMFAAMSSAVFVPAAVVAWGSPASLLLLWLGWCIGGIGAYFTGRLPGRAMARWLKTDGALRRLEGRLRPDTPFGMVLTLQVALPSEIQGILLGMVRYPLPRYVAGLVLAELPFAIATVYISAGLVERRVGLILAPGLAVAAVAVTAVYWMNRRLRVAQSGGRDE